MSKKQINLGNMAAAQKQSKAKPVEGHMHFQVRMARDDAARFKAALIKQGMSAQAGLIEAVNLLMSEWGESPVSDPGSAGKK